VTPAKRFVVGTEQRVTPRLEAGEGDDETERGNATWVRKQTVPRLRAPPLGKVESIEESSPASSVNLAEEHGVLQSVENTLPFSDNEAQGYEDNEDEELLFIIEESSKRRRITPQPQPHHSPPSSPASLFSSPHNHHVHTPTSASHRFKLPAPKAATTLSNHSTTAAPTTNRPHFILPANSSSPSQGATPLPETFSPSRKNGKYIQSGLASTLQSWIVETGEAGYTARNNTSSGGVIWGRDREDGVKHRVRITQVYGSRKGKDDESGSVECWAGGVVFVRGITDAGLYNSSRASSVIFNNGHGEGPGDSVGGGTPIAVLLAGQGGARGKAGVRIREGGLIGVRAPIWDVDVGTGGRGGGTWIVGVEWVVIS